MIILKNTYISTGARGQSTQLLNTLQHQVKILQLKPVPLNM